MKKYLLYGEAFSTIPFAKEKYDFNDSEIIKLSDGDKDNNIDKIATVLSKKYYEDRGNGDPLSKEFQYFYFVYRDSNILYNRMNGTFNKFIRYLNKKKIPITSDFYPDYVIHSQDISDYLEMKYHISFGDMCTNEKLENAVKFSEEDYMIGTIVKNMIEDYRNGHCYNGLCVVTIYDKEELFNLLNF